MHSVNDGDIAERRRWPRIPLTQSHISIEGEVYSLKDWSREGALVSDYTGALPVGEKVEIKLEINTNRGLLVIKGLAEIMRKQGTALGIRWYFQTMEDDDDRIALVDFFLHEGEGH